MAYHRTTDVKVLSGRISNPTSCDLFFLDHLLSQVHYIDRRLITGMGSNQKLVTFLYW